MKDEKNSVRRTLDWKLKRRALQNKVNGMPENWAVDALDCYLEGLSPTEIAQIMDVSCTSVVNAIAREALYRLMAQRQAERLEDVIPKEAP